MLLVTNQRYIQACHVNMKSDYEESQSNRTGASQFIVARIQNLHRHNGTLYEYCTESNEHIYLTMKRRYTLHTYIHTCPLTLAKTLPFTAYIRVQTTIASENNFVFFLACYNVLFVYHPKYSMILIIVIVYNFVKLLTP